MGGMAELLRDYVDETTKQIVDAPKEVKVSSSISRRPLSGGIAKMWSI